MVLSSTLPPAYSVIRQLSPALDIDRYSVARLAHRLHARSNQLGLQHERCPEAACTCHTVTGWGDMNEVSVNTSQCEDARLILQG